MPLILGHGSFALITPSMVSGRGVINLCWGVKEDVVSLILHWSVFHRLCVRFISGEFAQPITVVIEQSVGSLGSLERCLVQVDGYKDFGLDKTL